MSDNLRSLLFAVVLCLVCSTLLTAASSGLAPYQKENVQLDRQRNLLKSVNLIDPETKYPAEEIRRRYAENIRKIYVGRDGEVLSEDNYPPESLPVYLYQEKESVEAYIIPIDTRGLWGKIRGYMALDADGSTVTGFTVYQHSETPGLGGEIEQRWFQENFVGKKIVSRYGDFVSVSVAKGKASESVPAERQEHYVDGISGATLTGRFLTAGLKDVLSQYEPVSVRFRNKKNSRMPAALQ
jgi:Na+-transporting NADH:ubiquinone oxidoreductase subunit C